jgi:curved DNA-binding protein
MSAHDPHFSPEAARHLLGLPVHAGAEEAKLAFREAAKIVHPDRPGGDADRFRQIVAAYRTLQSAPRRAALAGPGMGEAYVEIGPLIALRGGEATAVLADGRRLRARIPPGARHGEALRIAGGIKALVRIAIDDGLQVRGSDLWMTARIAAPVLKDGGRAVIGIPSGARTLWISRKAAERGLLRLDAEGLPARGPHPQGDLFLRLVPETGLPEGPARAQLRAFAAAWAA